MTKSSLRLHDSCNSNSTHPSSGKGNAMVLKSARWLLMWSNALRFRVNPWVFSARFVPSILADLLGFKAA